jgi:hypothetical protein
VCERETLQREVMILILLLFFVLIFDTYSFSLERRKSSQNERRLAEKLLPNGLPSSSAPVSSVTFSSSGIYFNTKLNKLVYLEILEQQSFTCSIDHCSIFHSAISGLFHDFNATLLPSRYWHLPMDSPESCQAICKKFHSTKKKYSDTLLVFTTCNHIDMSVIALQSLREATDSFDIIIVDDHSVDGTPEYFIKKVELNCIF